MRLASDPPLFSIVEYERKLLKRFDPDQIWAASEQWCSALCSLGPFWGYRL